MNKRTVMSKRVDSVSPNGLNSRGNLICYFSFVVYKHFIQGKENTWIIEQ